MKSRITRILYAEVRKIDRFETCRVEAEAIVVEGDPPTAVMRRLKRWVATQVDEGPYEEETTDGPK